jgi:hypothetical protein
VATFTIANGTPVISNWPSASPITYGQALSNSVLTGGSANVPGAFAWVNPTNKPNTGTSNQSVRFSPAANYNSVTSSISLVVNKASPVLSWTPSPATTITYPAALSSTQLNATSSVAGTFSYNPSNTAVLNVGTNTLVATFTPTDPPNYTSGLTITNRVGVAKGSNVITFNSIPVKYLDEGSFTLTATASSGLAVNYTSSNTNVATVSGSTVSLKSVGTTRITASQAGNTNWNAAPNVPQTLTVQARDTDGDGVTDVMELADGTLTNNASNFNPLSKGLVAYYPFNGNANDLSGNGYHGEVGATTSISNDRFGVASKAYLFDGGTLGGIEAQNTEGLNFSGGKFTVSTWIQSSVLQIDNSIAGKHVADSQNGYGLGIWQDSPTFYVGSDPRLQAAQTYSDGRWHHVVGTWDGTRMALYINGILDVSKNWSYSNFNSARFMIGQSVGINPHGGGRFIGKIDDVRLYDRALSAAEVSQLHANEVGNLDSDGILSQSAAVPRTLLKLPADAAGLAGTYPLCSEGTAYVQLQIFLSGMYT